MVNAACLEDSSETSVCGGHSGSRDFSNTCPLNLMLDPEIREEAGHVWACASSLVPALAPKTRDPMKHLACILLLVPKTCVEALQPHLFFGVPGASKVLQL